MAYLEDGVSILKAAPLAEGAGVVESSRVNAKHPGVFV